jgi:uncharacterized membrane protein
MTTDEAPMHDDPPADANRTLPEHVESSVEALASLRADHRREASRYQRSIDAVTASVGRPISLLVITSIIVCWIGLNLGLAAVHLQPFDRPPFFWLQGLITTSALFVTILILTTQRHENQLAEHRAQLTLQIALIGERKTTKLIQRSEQHRRDNPHVATTPDPEASEMSSPVDPRAMSSAIRASQSEAEKG